MPNLLNLRGLYDPVDAETADHMDAFAEQSLGYVMLRLGMATAITAVMLLSEMILTGLVWGASVAIAEAFWTSRSRAILSRRGLMLRIQYYTMAFLNLVLVVTYLVLAVFLVAVQTPLMVLAAVIWVAGGFFAAVLVLVPDRLLMATTYGPSIVAMVAVANIMDWSWNDAKASPDAALTFAISLFFSMFIVRAFMMAGEFQRQAYADKQALEARRAAAERASVNKTAFLARMSHEIRTPLNGVLGCASLLSQTDLDGRQKHLAGQILRSGDTLLDVLNDVLDISRIEVGGLELELDPFDLGQLFEDSVNLMIPEAEHRGVVILTHIDNRLPREVIGDVPRIRQIFLNLLSNAIKFNESGEFQASLWHSGVTQEPGIVLSVELTETGQGMAPLLQLGPFNPFSDSYQPGNDFQKSAGLGLIISRDLAEQMNGAMTLEETTQGIRLKVTLPLAAEAGSQPIGATWTEALEGKSLMLISSEDMASHRHQASLQAAGLKVDIAADAMAACAMAERRADTDSGFDLVALSSPVLTRDLCSEVTELRQHPAFQASRFVCNSGRSDVADEVTRSAFDAVISHSIRPKRLPSVLAQIIGENRRRRRATPSIPNLAGARILLAEDDVSNQMLLKALLEPTGATVEIVEDGVAAVQSVLREPPDLVLMDIRMPRLDGIEAAIQIRQTPGAGGTLPIIAVSANAKDEDRQRFVDAGMNAYLPKPVVVDEIYDLLKTHLSGGFRNVGADETKAASA